METNEECCFVTPVIREYDDALTSFLCSWCLKPRSREVGFKGVAGCSIQLLPVSRIIKYLNVTVRLPTNYTIYGVVIILWMRTRWDEPRVFPEFCLNTINGTLQAAFTGFLATRGMKIIRIDEIFVSCVQHGGLYCFRNYVHPGEFRWFCNRVCAVGKFDIVRKTG